MSNSLDYSLLYGFRNCAAENADADVHEETEGLSRAGHASRALDDRGLRGKAPWRSIPLWVSNDRAEAYFEIYQVVRVPALVLRGEAAEWRWRFCAPDGQVRASSGAYTNAEDCRDAIDALRRTAGGARVRQASNA